MNTDNELIAEFMGGVSHDLDDGFGKINRTIYFYPGINPNPHCGAGTYKRPIELDYHGRWDWLHPVVDKIESLMLSIKIPDDLGVLKNGTHGSEPYIDVVSLSISSPISEVYEAVVKFIKWYNTTKQEQTEKPE